MDLHERLLAEEEQGNLLIHRYEHSKGYRKRIAEHIVDRIIRFEIDLTDIAETDARFSRYYKGIVHALAQIMDGHLLQ